MILPLLLFPKLENLQLACGSACLATSLQIMLFFAGVKCLIVKS
jgi:hypothetical protein